MLNFKGVDFFPHGLRMPIVKNRRYFIGVSWALAILSLALIFTKGLNLGVDFKGGSIIEVRSTKGPIDIAKVRELANSAGLGGIQVQGLREPTDALLRMEMQTGGDQAQEVATTKLIKTLGETYEIRNKEVIGGAVSKELLSAGIWAVAASLLGILLYVWFRFEWQFAVAAILALVHDVFITTGMFSLLGYEFDLTVVAALLTLAGYSVNDTVVVFDRIRENMRKFKKLPLWDLIDLSINETLSRTVLTAGTVFLAVLALYIFGTEVIHGFAFAMLFGVLIGTWSSIFVAAPLLMFFGLTREKVTGQKDDQPKGGAAKQGAKA
jgi:preprotein translocase subunit SecF